MDSGSTSGDNNYQYRSAQWTKFLQRNSSAPAISPSATSAPSTPTTAVEYFPDLLQQQLSISQAQLAQYSKLISPGRTTRIQPSPLHPVVSTPHIEAIRGDPQSPRVKAGSGQERSKKIGSQGGHGNRKVEQHTGTGERPAITTMETRTDRRKNMVLPTESPVSRPGIRQASSSFSQQSNSVPSTPHQRPRQYSFDSREPSPGAPVNHSPRSAYSESNSTLPSLRALPPRFGGCRYETAPQHGKRRMPYNIGADQLEKAKPGSVKAKLTAEEERNLSRDMGDLYTRLLPTPNCEANRKKFILKLEKLLNDEWPGHDIQVHMFGSSGNLLCTDDSDVDICITTPWKELESVCKLAELLAKHGMEKVICVSSAKVPIVKIWDPELCLACDMNVNNTLALENTRMVKTYVEIDPRVRPLAMIVKHWTRRRIVNDAAFGGTLSSYTWICMIITFLQLRTPPLLPSLHQRPHQKLAAKGGKESSFADDVQSLKTFGKANKETLGELLFHFFRFYGHEFDYDKYVLSVRNGKLVGKMDKGWHITANNRLCVEEPFNTNRNLGNTADDTSVRGLHMEIRRAFDLIAQAKLEECCEQYVYPKEEERIWSKAPPQPKPVLAAPVPPPRRGNHRGGGGGGGRNNQPRNQGNGGRRASSGASNGAFDNVANFNLTPNGAPTSSQKDPSWAHAHNVQTQLHNDLYQKFSVLQAQENSLRMHLYHRSQAYAAQAHAHAMAHNPGVGMNANSVLPVQHGTNDHTGNNMSALENPPLSAPIRPEYYYYPLQYHGGQHMYGSPSPSTYPSSPAMSSAAPELRRSLHRSSGNGNIGGGVSVPNSSLRSHSQPASRTGLGLTVPIQSMNGTHQPFRGSGSMVADENLGPSFELDSSLAESPPDNSMPKEYVGYYVNESQPIVRRSTIQQLNLPTFGDASARPRRLSTDQFPQAMILDRLRRTSRSPSPLGHSRAYSSGAFSAPLTSTPQFAAQSNPPSQDPQKPVIVNGSDPSSVPDEYQSAATNGIHLAEYMKELHNNRFLRTEDNTGRESYQQSPPVVNGSVSGPTNIVMTTANGPQNGISEVPSTPTNSMRNIELVNGSRLSPNESQRIVRQPPVAGMSPLDLTGPHDNKKDDISHLSPVYETRSPSPSTTRRFESDVKNNDTSLKQNERQTEKPALPKQPPRNALPDSQQKQAPPKVNGHTRAAKSEGGMSGQWQQMPTRKNKKGGSTNSKSTLGGQTTGEQLPKHDAERKGG